MAKIYSLLLIKSAIQWEDIPKVMREPVAEVLRELECEHLIGEL